MERSATNPQSPSPHPSTSNWSISKAWGQGCAESFDHGDHTSVDTSLPECFCSGCAWQGIKPFWTHWVSVCLSCSGFPAALHTWIWTLITWHFTTFLKYTHARTLKCVLCIVALVLTPPPPKKKSLVCFAAFDIESTCGFYSTFWNEWVWLLCNCSFSLPI